MLGADSGASLSHIRWFVDSSDVVVSFDAVAAKSACISILSVASLDS